MNALVDTNVWLDILLGRDPFAADSEHAVGVCLAEGVDAQIAATSLKDVFYVVAKVHDVQTAYDCVGKILDLTRVATIDDRVCRDALKLERPDYEDGLVAAAALAEGVDAIITRDAAAFRELSVPKYRPEEFVASMGYEELDFWEDGGAR